LPKQGCRHTRRVVSMAVVFCGRYSRRMFTDWSHQLPPQRTPGHPSSLQT
jgi:hypothetical protein